MKLTSRPGRSCWLWLSLAGAAACPTVVLQEEPAPTPALETVPEAAPPAPPTAPTSGPPPASPPPPGRDHRSAVACSTDADCGWDNPCHPQRCVEPGPALACDESWPSPGSCLCLAGACTLKPDTPPTPAGGCELRGCVVDRAGGRCVADTGGVGENLRSRQPVDVGPSCDCIKPGEGCTFTWFDPVPCESERDCWVSPSPRRHPIARPAHLRRRDFKPCADGEAGPRCNAGQCVVGPAYSC